jgi:plastocyanin
MNTLDSRSLAVGDCFAVKFTVPGAFRHVIAPGGHAAAAVGRDEGFSITVAAKRDPAAPAKQHNLLIRKVGGQLAPDTAALSIEIGDTVLWHTTDPAAAGFAVAGSGENFAFGNQRLGAEAIYTHAFGSPGTFEWTDPAARSISGAVVVNPVTPQSDKERQAWLDSLSQGKAFEIRGGRVTPEKVEIVVGQTVYWKVWDGDGVAIVDKRLLG